MLIPFWKHQRRRWMGQGVLIVGITATLVFGIHLRHVHGLDEPLFIAAAEGDVARVQALMTAGACPDATREDETSALAAARRTGHAEVVSALRRAGAVEPMGVLGLD